MPEPEPESSPGAKRRQKKPPRVIVSPTPFVAELSSFIAARLKKYDPQEVAEHFCKAKFPVVPAIYINPEETPAADEIAVWVREGQVTVSYMADTYPPNKVLSPGLADYYQG